MSGTNNRLLFWAVAFGHMTVDMFNGMGPVLLAFLSAHVLNLTNTQLGFAVSAYSFAGAISQPLFGWRCDRTGGRWLGAGGVAWTVSLLMLSMALAQATGQFGLMLIPFMLAPIGSGAFHPTGAMHASESSETGSAGRTSMFFLMGQIGLAIGPALAGFLLDHSATHNSLFTKGLGPAFSGLLMERGTVAPVLALAILAVPPVLLMAYAIPNFTAHCARRAATAARDAAQAANAGAFPVKAFVLLAIVVTLRSLINPGAAAFIPRLFQAKGWDATEYGMITSLFWLGGGLAGVWFGSMADKFDTRYLVAVTLVLAAPALFLLPMLEGAAAFAMALAVGALSGGSHSLIVVLAQSLIPGRKGFASGAILGFMFTTGALGSLLIGTMADKIGLESAFHVVAAVTVLAGVLGLALPPDKRRAAAPKLEAVTLESATSGAD
jgi:MFS transporter, FSR family, fosmidomycin resistance protein